MAIWVIQDINLPFQDITLRVKDISEVFQYISDVFQDISEMFQDICCNNASFSSSVSSISISGSSTRS
jgi:hypothetical protein